MVHEGTSMKGNAENGGVRRMGHGRIATWGAAALLLPMPWVAGAPWSVSDFVFAGDPDGDRALVAQENPLDPDTWVWTSADDSVRHLQPKGRFVRCV